MFLHGIVQGQPSFHPFSYSDFHSSSQNAVDIEKDYGVPSMCTSMGKFLFRYAWKYFVEYRNHIEVYCNGGLCRQCSWFLIKNTHNIPTFYLYCILFESLCNLYICFNFFAA